MEVDKHSQKGKGWGIGVWKARVTDWEGMRGAEEEGTPRVGSHPMSEIPDYRTDLIGGGGNGITATQRLVQSGLRSPG